MSRQINTYCIKIPYNAFAIYCEKKNILTVRGSKKKKSIRIKLKIKIDPVKKIINVSPVPSYQISNAEKKKNSNSTKDNNRTIKTSIYRKFYNNFSKTKNRWCRLQSKFIRYFKPKIINFKIRLQSPCLYKSS